MKNEELARLIGNLEGKVDGLATKEDLAQLELKVSEKIDGAVQSHVKGLHSYKWYHDKKFLGIVGGLIVAALTALGFQVVPL